MYMCMHNGVPWLPSCHFIRVSDPPTKLCDACSVSDETVPQELRGKYSAFALQDSAGVNHLKTWQAAGLTHVHLLPSYDYGSVPERAEDQAAIKVCSCGMRPCSVWAYQSNTSCLVPGGAGA